MAERNVITYGIDREGVVVSRKNFGDKLAFHISKSGMETIPIHQYYNNITKWTKKIPLSIKNEHRKYWGMKPLKRMR